MKTQKSCLFLLQWVLISFCHTQPVSQPPAQVFTFQNGLPDLTINSLTQDDDGYLWIGTTNGLSRYDGSEFVNYYHHANINSLPGNTIISLITLPRHLLLIATTSGLSILQTQTGHFTNLIISSTAEMFSFENYFLSIAADSEHTVWAGSKTTLYHLDDQLNILQEFRGMAPGDVNKERLKYAQKITVLNDGSIVARLQTKEKNGFFLYDVKMKIMLPITKSADQRFNFLSDENIHNVVTGLGNDCYYMKYNSDSLFHYDVAKNSVKTLPLFYKSNPEDFSYSSELIKMSSGELFCTLSNGGFIQLGDISSHKQSLLRSVKEIILRERMIYAIRQDRDNNLWVGTNNGLYKYSLDNSFAQTSTLISDKAHQNFEAGTIRLVNSNIFIATSGAGFFIKHKDLNEWKNIVWNERPGWRFIWDINKSNSPDTFWVGTQSGLCWWNCIHNTHGSLLLNGSHSLIDSVPVTTQFIDHANRLWMGAGFGNGVFVYGMNNHTLSSYSKNAIKNSLPIRHPTAITEDQEGNIWMGGQDGTGLVELKSKAQRFTIYHPLYNTSFDNGIIYTLFTDKKGYVWVGTAGGLIKWNIHTNEAESKFDISSGLSSNIIYTCCPDSSGHLWLGTNNGLNCIDMNTNTVARLHAPDNFTQEAITGIMFDQSGQRLYFTTPQAVTSLLPTALFSTNSSPEVRIVAVQSSGQSLDFNSRFKLPYDENNLAIYFTGINLSDGLLNNYFYQLKGVSDKWISLGHQRMAGFYNLPPGKYVFTIRAETANGTWSINTSNITFIILTPFWRTWWFIVFISLVVAGILYAVFKYRIHQLVILQKVRNRIATDLHDDIGSTLTNIHILTELSRNNIDKPAEASLFLNRISEEIGNSNQALDDIVWSINTDNDSMEQIVTRMRRYAAEVFDNDNILYTLHLDERLIHKKPGMELRRDVYLIFKELLNNIYKHAFAKKVTIEIVSGRRNLQIRIEDDGIGFDPQKAVNRNGLKNILSRVNKWKGSYTLSSLPGKGTTIQIILPLEL